MDHYDAKSSSEVLYTVLERCVRDVLSLIKPSESDRVLRLNAIDEIVKSVQSIATLNGAAVKPFGSFVSNLYSKWGDLDISITLDQQFNSCASRKKKQTVLREIMKTLRKRGIARKIQFIPQARVPLLEYESSMYGISCDVSVDNHQGRAKSKILQLITSFDERFADIVLLIKEWAKAHNINDPKAGTLNSYSLCLLVIFHLQTCKPAILPPLKEIYDGNISDDVKGVDTEREREIDDICAWNVRNIMSHISSHKNKSSLANLLISFFDKFSEIEALSSEYVMCTFTGRWESMASKTKWTEKSYCLYIEDPFEQPDNAARAVGSNNLRNILGVVHTTRRFLSSSSVLSDHNSLIHLLSRPLVASLLSAPVYTPQQANNMHQFPNMTGNLQTPEHIGYCVSAFAESSINQDRNTKTRATGKMHANQSTHVADGSNSSQRSKRNGKNVYNNGSSSHPTYGNLIDRSDTNYISQPANGTAQSNLRGELAEYCVPQIANDPHNNFYHQSYYSAQPIIDRTSQDHVMNVNESRGIRSAINEPKHDGLTRNRRNNNQKKFAGRPPEIPDQHHTSGSRGVHKTGRVDQSRPLVGHTATQTGSIDRAFDAGITINGSRIHRSGLAIVEPVTEQLNHGLKLNGSSNGYNRSNKGKQVWQPKFVSNQHVFQ